MASSDTVTHRMMRTGATDGQVTGDHHRFRRGDEIEAPEGEFAHLAGGSYQTRPMEAEGEAGPAGAEEPFSLGEHIGGGWYEVREEGAPVTDDEGEVVTAGPGKDEALRQIKLRNDEVRP